MQIEKFLSKNNKPIRESRVQKFKKLSEKVNSKEELRVLEEQLLKPEKLQKYTGVVSGAKTIEDRIIEVVFASEEDISLFAEFFQVVSKRNLKIKKSVYKIDLLLTFLKALKNKEIKYNAKKQKFLYITAYKKRNNKGIK